MMLKDANDESSGSENNEKEAADHLESSKKHNLFE
jgi:hypothetical protein